jgi:exopolysaccharide biosynthesis polyprenyl glycosylphosphotransferase
MLIAASVLAATTADVAVGFWGIVLVPLWVLLAKLQGLYDRDHRSLRHLTVDELPAIVTWATTGTAATTALMSLTPAGALSAAEAVRLWLILILCAPLLRGAARVLWRRMTPPERTLLIGSGPLERATRRKLQLFSDIHVEVIGHVDEQAVLAASDARTLRQALRRAGHGSLPERLIVAAPVVDERLIALLVGFCKAEHVKLSVVPPARGMFGTAVRLGHVADLPVIEYHTADSSRSTLLLKRALDIAVSSLLLAVVSPLLLLIALAIKLDGPGPVLFRQARVGSGGRPFRMLKFRTMVADAEEQLAHLVSLDELAAPMFKFRRDPRVTGVGRVLRRWSLDELPQLVNVLGGSMSLVGPRPEQRELVDRYRSEDRFRLAVKPGLTGPMQVYGRGELAFDERLAVEREYVENLSLGRDLRILLLTLPTIVSGRGAF